MPLRGALAGDDECHEASDSLALLISIHTATSLPFIAVNRCASVRAPPQPVPDTTRDALAPPQCSRCRTAERGQILLISAFAIHWWCAKCGHIWGVPREPEATPSTAQLRRK